MKTRKFFQLALLFFAITSNSFAQNTTLSTAETTGTAGNGGNQNVHLGFEAGKVSSANTNVFVGFRSGLTNSSGIGNSFVGFAAGRDNSTGAYNLFFGYGAGSKNTTGINNVYIGAAAGISNEVGQNNVFIGHNSGTSLAGHSGNTLCGQNSGKILTAGDRNTFFGTGSGGLLTSGNGNVFIGNNAGGNIASQSSTLYIANTSTNTPLIYGEFNTAGTGSNAILKLNSKVGIGHGIGSFPTTLTNGSSTVSIANYNLFVDGGILTDEVRVRTTWADYVFKPNYDLISLPELETFIKKNGHLPNVPSEATVLAEGIEVGNIIKIQQEKIEELTLYLIELNKEVEKLKKQVKNQSNKLVENNENSK